MNFYDLNKLSLTIWAISIWLLQNTSNIKTTDQFKKKFRYLEAYIGNYNDMITLPSYLTWYTISSK